MELSLSQNKMHVTPFHKSKRNKSLYPLWMETLAMFSSQCVTNMPSEYEAALEHRPAGRP